jgi:hypothetical protein
MSRYSPENQFILDCLRSHFQPDLELKIDSCLNWDAILESAGRHRVVPHLYQALRSLPIPGALKEQYDFNALHSLKLAGELKRAIAFLPVPVIPFKGPILAFQAYGNVSYRQFDDLDLLIYRNDFPLVKATLLKNGYQIVDKLSPDQEAAFLQSHHHCQFFNVNQGISLEVHWQIAPKIYSFRIDVSDIFYRSVKVSMFGQEISTLSQEDALLVLSEHGTRHYWSRLAWICDIARLCQSELDWQETLDRARSLGILRATLLAVSLAVDVLGAKVPDLSSQVADKSISRLAGEVADRLFSKFSPTDPITELFYVRCRERERDKLRYYIYRATVPTQEDWTYIDLPGYLFPFYGLVRPIRLISMYGSKVVKWLR